jgi:hypothetical protein
MDSLQTSESEGPSIASPVGLSVAHSRNGHHREVRAVTPPPRRHADGDGDDRIDNLVTSVTALTDSLRDMSTSWVVERTQLIHDVREIREKATKIDTLAADMEGIKRFIEGDGKDHHVGQRLHGLDLRNEQRDKEIADVKREAEKTETALSLRLDKMDAQHQRLMWAIVGASVTALGACIMELVQFLGKK